MKSETRTILEAVRAERAVLDALHERLKLLTARSTTVKSMMPTDVRVQTSPSNLMESIIAEKDEVEREYVKALHRYDEAYKRAMITVERVQSPRHKEALLRRYLSCESYYDISAAMNYSYDYTRRLVSDALKKLEVD